MSNRNLLIGLVALLVIFLAGKFLSGDKTNSFDPILVAVDTAKVDLIKFEHAGAAPGAFELRRVGDHWEALQGDIKVKAPAASVLNILAPLVELQAKRVVTKDVSRYAEYEIDESKAGHVSIWQGKKKLADLMLGGFRFDQTARTASSFIKKHDEKAVYEIDGFVSMGLKARFDQFRDKKLVKAKAADIDALDLVDRSGQKHGFRRIHGIWYFAGMEELDSTAFSGYIDGLISAQGSAFSPLTSTQGLQPLESLTLSGNNMYESTVISVYAGEDPLMPHLIHSSSNEESIFLSDSTGLYKKIFTDLRQFSPYGQ